MRQSGASGAAMREMHSRQPKTGRCITWSRRVVWPCYSALYLVWAFAATTDIGLTSRTIHIDRDESRQAGIVSVDARKMRLERFTCGNLTPRQGPGERGGRHFTGAFATRHDASMHELPGIDEGVGTGLAFGIPEGAVHG